MRKIIILAVISLSLLAISFNPLFNYVREYTTADQINMRYEIQHAEKGYNIINVQELNVDGVNIKIMEEETGRKGTLTPWDIEAHVPPGDIVKIQYLLNDQKISTPDEIWLSNRDRGSRYFSWIDILTVKDRETGEEQISIVQRLTDDDEPMENRRWKIITIAQEGSVKEEVLSYAQRSKNLLGVKLIEFSYTSLMSMGYYSDITKGYPSIFFPLLYPFLTGVTGLFIMLIVIVLLLIKYCNSRTK